MSPKGGDDNCTTEYSHLTNIIFRMLMEHPSTQGLCQAIYPPRPLLFPTPGKTVPHHPLGDGHQVTVPHPPLGDRTTTVHAHLQAQKLQHKMKEFSIRFVQRAANVRRPTP